MSDAFPRRPRHDGCKGQCPRPLEDNCPAACPRPLEKPHLDTPRTRHRPSLVLAHNSGALLSPQGLPRLVCGLHVFMTRHLLPWTTRVPRTHRWRPLPLVWLYLGQVTKALEAVRGHLSLCHMTRQLPALQEASQHPSQMSGLQTTGKSASALPAGQGADSRHASHSPGVSVSSRPVRHWARGPWQAGPLRPPSLCTVHTSASLPLPLWRRTPSGLPAAATCVLALLPSFVTSRHWGPLLSPPLLSKARARDSAHV